MLGPEPPSGSLRFSALAVTASELLDLFEEVYEPRPHGVGSGRGGGGGGGGGTPVRSALFWPWRR